MTETPVSETLNITVSRRIEAVPSAVFDAWLAPERVARFLFATPEGRMEAVSLDPWVGGAFHISERRGQILAEHSGQFLVLDRPNRIAFTFSAGSHSAPTRVDVAIADEAGGSLVTLSHEIDPQWSPHADRVRGSWASILDSLARTIED